jgi:DNA (cytosine-5)-methyltransferase 1
MRARLHKDEKPIVLSLFSGCGGLDLGFESAGFEAALAFDLRSPAVDSYNHNRDRRTAHVADVTKLRLRDLDEKYGSRFDPVGVIGGPPCQSFSRGNSNRSDNDPRSKLIRKFFSLALRLHKSRSGLDFIVMENVLEVAKAKNGKLLKDEIARLELNGFSVFIEETNALKFGVAQKRRRLILIALNKSRRQFDWNGLEEVTGSTKVRDVIGALAEPVWFSDFKEGMRPVDHLNHICMTPKSKKFQDGSLLVARSSGRCFKVLDWDKPSYTVSYGHREVHIHPSGHRRLSVYEAMLLQGFPHCFELVGTLSDQISQVSEAVPPPLAEAVAKAVKKCFRYENRASNSSRAAA